MTLLLQAAMQPSAGPTWQSIVIVFGGLIQTVLVMWIITINNERRETRKQLESQGLEIVRLVTLVTGGSGMSAQIERLVVEVTGLRKDVHDALEEIAEQRGRDSRRIQST